MANRFDLPLQTPVDATGAPYPGGKLFFYQSGTSTKLNTYSDEDLSIANSNPVVLDSAGRYPNAIFLQDLPYKVILAPSTDSDPPTASIWTQDPVYASDYSTIAQVQGVNGSPNGQLAGTAASATIPASMAWDYTNNILYVCSTSGTTTTAVWTAINAATAAAVVPPPQGYLTLTSGVPVIPSDVTAATTIYYTPYNGNLVPIYNGSSFVPISFTELSYTLTSSLVASNIYDLYVFNLNGVPTLGSGPSWSAGTGGSITAGSCARGTGSGGSALTKLSGINVNAVSMVIRYGNGTVTETVAAQQATYVGSLFMDGTNGQVSCYRSWGQNRKWGVWNAYNRVPIAMVAGDNTANWSYTSTTPRAANNNTANKVTSFCGLAEEVMDVEMKQNLGPLTSGCAGSIGVGVNSTSAFSGVIGTMSKSNDAGPILFTLPASAHAMVSPQLGISTITMLEAGSATSIAFYGTQSNMQMEVNYRG